MKNSKVKSEKTYYYEAPDGSGIQVMCSHKGHYISWHTDHARKLFSLDDAEIEVRVSKMKLDGVLNTPIGGIQSHSPSETKEFVMSMKQYRDFIVRFWENGHEYYDQI